MLNTLSFKKKLLLLCSFMAAVSITIGLLAYTGLRRVEVSNKRIIDEVIPNSNLINSLDIHFNKIRVELRTLGLEGLNKVSADLAVKNTMKEIEAYEEDNKFYASKSFLPGEKEVYEEVQTNWKHFRAIGEKVLALYKSGRPEDMAAMTAIFFKECPEAAEAYKRAIDKALAYHKTNLDKFSIESNEISQTVNIMIISISLITISLSLVVGFVFANSTARSINEIVHSLIGSAENVSAASIQIAASSEQLSHSTTNQAASLQETSSSLDEINSMISSNSENAKQSEISAGKSLESAEKGKEVVEKMIHAIEEINVSNNSIMSQINQSNKEMEDIVKVIGEIELKTKVINDIVFQTKLLSFNASVEAARAGEHGKGFSVVAEEVGKLAAMSGAAAIEISKMLESSVGKVESIVQNSRDKMGKLIEEGKHNVEVGSAIAQECGQVLNEIVSSVAVVTKSVSEISTASQEQAQGVHEITKAIAQLDQVTQENTSNSADSANAAEELSNQAANLKKLVQDLMLTMEGMNKQPQVVSASASIISLSAKRDDRAIKASSF